MSGHSTLATTAANRIVMAVLASFGILLMASVVQDVWVYSASPPLLNNKVWLLDVDVERSLYTWLSSVVLFSIAGLLIVLGIQARSEGQPFFMHWLLLGAVFILLSADEAVAMHEKLSAVLSNTLNTSGIFYFAWTIPALLLLGIGFFFYIPFLKSLQPAVAGTMVLSAAIYLMGAVGMELVAGGYVEDVGVETLTYRTMANLEEALEGIGLTLFLGCLLRAYSGVPWRLLPRGAPRSSNVHSR